MWEKEAESGHKTTRSGNDYHAGLLRSKSSEDFLLLMVVNGSGMWWWIAVIERGFGSSTGSFGGGRYWGDRVGFFSRLPVSGAIAICDEGWRDILSTGGSAVKIL